MGKNFRPVFDDRASAVLLELYNSANGTHTSYSLAWKLNPTVTKGTPEALTTFTETRDATEQLIAKGLVGSKERFAGADGIYFKGLRLTAKGQKVAIQHKQEVLSRKSLTQIADFLQGVGDAPDGCTKTRMKKRKTRRASQPASLFWTCVCTCTLRFLRFTQF
jgi:hypothetical protein